MALLFMDSFDHYATADIALGKWTSVGVGFNGASVIAAVGRRGSNGYKFFHPTGNASNYTEQLFKTLAPGDNSCILGVAFNPVTSFSALDAGGTSPDTFPTLGSCPLLAVRNAGATQCWVKVNTDGTLQAYTGSTLLGTTSVPLTNGVYTYVEIKITVHNTTGVVVIRFNGVTVLNLTAQNTRAGAANLWNEIRLGPPSANSGALTSEWDIDDLYVLDGTGAAPWNAFLGDCRVDARMPTAPGANAAWAPSAAPNWSCVDEIPANGDTDFVSATTPGLIDTHTTQDAPSVGSAIFGVQHCLNMKKLDAGVCSVAPAIRIGGVDYIGADLQPGVAYGYGLQIAQVSPATAAQWTEAGFNAAEFGYKKTA